ncbi:MAG TPA: hypothetical protein VFR37_02850 [Longimicrobium sp.]|nr:hypothetical protein [Longimicrobium sp.]
MILAVLLALLPATACAPARAVPDVPPQTTPAWFADPTKSIPCYGRTLGTCVSGVLSVEFHAGATREERQAAVNAVGGRVVGGGGTQYYVHMPSVTTRAGLDSVMVRLRELPQVRQISVYDTSPASIDEAAPAS